MASQHETLVSQTPASDAAVEFEHVSPGIVTFAFEPPPVQSAEEFRRSFAAAFQGMLARQAQAEQTAQAEQAAPAV